MTREDFKATHLGGYSDAALRDAFHHGIDAAFDYFKGQHDDRRFELFKVIYPVIVASAIKEKDAFAYGIEPLVADCTHKAERFARIALAHLGARANEALEKGADQ